MTQKETLEMLKNICRNCLANEPSDPTEREIGYSAAMEDIIKIIDDNPINLIGKYGYFWDDTISKSCRYGILVEFDGVRYYCETYNKGSFFGFYHFSLTIPEHLK
jgi:hypothetical protein